MMTRTHPMTTRSYASNDIPLTQRARDSRWWDDVKSGMKRHIEERQASDRCVTLWGLFGLSILLCWLAFTNMGSSFWEQVFCCIIISECLFSDGCLFGSKTQMPDWVNESSKKRRNEPRRAWENMY